MESVDLPVQPPIEPMLAKAAAKVPGDPGVWSYEPKWDGFRALVFRDGDDVVLLSRSGKDLGRYFPELLDSLRDELVRPLRARRRGRGAAGDRRTDAAGLGIAVSNGSIPPRAGSRCCRSRRLRTSSVSTHWPPAIARCSRSRSGCGGRHLLDAVDEKAWCHVTRTTEDPELGAQWLDTFEGAGLDGVIAKRLDGQYLPGKREMVKVKHARDADCVAIGYRIHKSGEGVGSILLGLYRDDGELQMIGGAASFSVKDRIKLLADLEPLREGDQVNDGEPQPVELRGRQALDTGASGDGSPRWPTTRWRATPSTDNGSGTP